MWQTVEFPLEPQTAHQIFGTRKVGDDLITGVGRTDVFKGDGVAVRKVHEGDRRRPHRVPGKRLLRVVFGLHDEVRIVEFHLFALCFKNGRSLPVDEEQVVGLESPFHRRLSDRCRRHAGGKLVPVDDVPPGFIELAVDPYAGAFFRFEMRHKAKSLYCFVFNAQ